MSRRSLSSHPLGCSENDEEDDGESNSRKRGDLLGKEINDA